MCRLTIPDAIAITIQLVHVVSTARAVVAVRQQTVADAVSIAVEPATVWVH